MQIPRSKNELLAVRVPSGPETRLLSSEMLKNTVRSQILYAHKAFLQVSLRNFQLDAAQESLPVLTHCRHCAVFGDLFGAWTSARALRAQYVALGEGIRPLLGAAWPTGSAGAVVQRLAASLPQELRSMEGLRRRRQILLEALSRAGLSAPGGRPRAGGHLVAKLPEDIDEGQYCSALERHGVAAEAGSALGCPGCVRLCFSQSFDLLEDSVPVFATAVQEVRRGVRGEAAAAAAKKAAKARSKSTQPSAEQRARADETTPEEAPITAADDDAAAQREAPPAEEVSERLEAEAAVEAPEDEAVEVVDGPPPEPATEVEVPETRPSTSSSEPPESVDAGPQGVEREAEIDTAALAAAEKRGDAAPLPAQLRQGARAVACVAQLSGAITTELIAQAGFELIIVDHENGPGDFFSAANLVRSSVGAGAHCILRLPCAEHTQVYRALDAGAEGLLLPQVQSRGEAEAFGALVRKVSERTRDDEYLEWRSSPLPLPEAATAGDEDPIPVPRPLVAVEMDPSCTIDVAEELLKAEGVDLVLVDPDRCLESILAEYRVNTPAPEDATSSQGFPPRVPLASGNAESPRAKEPDAPGNTLRSATPPPGPPPTTTRRSQASLKAPLLSARLRAAAGGAAALPVAAAEAMQNFWSGFDALPSHAAERRKLVGCSAHGRTAPFDLLVQGHSVVALCADLALLREGAYRHVTEMKSERHHGAQQRHWAAPLESARARLATSALVSQLRRQKKAVAAFLHLGDALAAEAVANAGFEALVLDHEQGPGDLLNAVGLVHAAASAGTHPLLRVPSNDPGYLRRALQLGFEGLILPMTETAEQAAQFVAMARRSFPAMSSLRGSGGPGAAAVRSAAPVASQFLRRRGEDLLMKAVQVETETGLANVRDIAKVEGLDMVFFAPVELAASAPRGQEAGLLLALETAEAEVKRAKKLLGGMLVPGRSAEMMFAAGYDLVCTTSDVILVRAAAENIVREAKPPATGPKGGLVRFVTSGREAKFARNDETLVARLKKSRQARAFGRAPSGFEVVVLDHARGAEDLLGAVALVHAASRAGAHSLMRVPALSQAHLRRALQVGVEGIILPGVESAEGRGTTPPKRAPPVLGEARLKNQPFRRMDFSFAPPLVEFYGQRVAEFSRRQGEALLIAAQVDSPEGAARIREIVKVEGIDMIFVDAMRLSGADVERIETAAKKHHRLLGGLLVPGCHVEDMYRAGYKLVCAASDHGLLAEGLELEARRPASSPSDRRSEACLGAWACHRATVRFLHSILKTGPKMDSGKRAFS
eukprot:s581_g5.t3